MGFPNRTRIATSEAIKLSLKEALDNLGCSLIKTGRLYIYKAAYLAALYAPARNRRQREARARRFAKLAQENTDRHGPLACAVALNGILISLGGLVTVRHATEKGDGGIEVSLNEGFLTPQSQPEPPSGGSTSATQAVLDQAAQAMMTASPTAPTPVDLSALTTTANTALSFEIKATAPSAPSAQALAALTAASGTGTSTQGQGEGTGQGTGTGANTGSNTATSNGAPGKTFSVAGLTLPAEEKIWVVIDGSSSMQKHGKAATREISRYAKSRRIVECQNSSYMHTIGSFYEGIKRGYKTIVWITDLVEHHEYEKIRLEDWTNKGKPLEQIGWDAFNSDGTVNIKRGIPTNLLNTAFLTKAYIEFPQLLKEKGVVLYISSTQNYPSTELYQIVRESGGQIALLPAD